MTTINFPASPTQGQIYTFQDRSWIWNGRAWQSKSVFLGYTGSQGATGADGADGATGFTGSQGLSGEAAAIGFTGSAGAGFTGSQGVEGDPGGTTLTVTSPYGGIYIVYGANKPVLNFIRGNRYVININATNHPFYLQTSGLTYDAYLTYTNGVTGNGTQVGTIIFQVPYNAPDTLTYVCGYHANMGNTINISNLGPTGFTGSTGESSFVFSDNPPAEPLPGDRWYDTTQGLEFVWIVDIDGGQWVEITTSGTGFTGSQGFVGSTGAGLNVVDVVAAAANLPVSYVGEIGDGIVTEDTGNLYIWDGTQWNNVGQIQGYTGSQGDIGFTGSQGDIGYTGSQGESGLSVLTIYNTVGDLPASADTGAFALVADISTLYVYTGAAWVDTSSNLRNFFYIAQVNAFTAPIVGDTGFVPTRTIQLQSIEVTVASKTSNITVRVKKNSSTLQDFIIGGNALSIISDFTANTITTADTVFLDIPDGSGIDLIAKFNYK